MFLLSGVNVFEARLISISQHSKGKETGSGYFRFLSFQWKKKMEELSSFDIFIFNFVRKSALTQFLCCSVYICTYGFFPFFKVYTVS